MDTQPNTINIDSLPADVFAKIGKVCGGKNGCGQRKLFSDFHKNPTNHVDGYCRCCKACKKRYSEHYNEAHRYSTTSAAPTPAPSTPPHQDPLLLPVSEIRSRLRRNLLEAARYQAMLDDMGEAA